MELAGEGKVTSAPLPVFICGPLMHEPLLNNVLGRTVDPAHIYGAVLSGYALEGIKGQPLVAMHAHAGDQVGGKILTDVSAPDLKRLTFYLGSLGFDPESERVARDDGTLLSAIVFQPRNEMQGDGLVWARQEWQALWGDIAQAAAKEIMAQMGQLTPDEIAARLTGIHIRAAAFVAAQARSVGATRDLTRDVVVQAHHHKYSNFFAAQELDLQYRRYDGRLSPVMNRGAQMLGQASVVLPYDPVRDEVLMVEQFRAPLYIGGDREPWLWQPVAGLVDPGETPRQAAHREAIEEAGLTLNALHEVAGVYSSPGASSDFVNLFVGLADFGTRQKGGGLEQEGEDIKVGIVSFEVLMLGIDRGRYRDMQLVLSGLWLARNHDRLRLG